MTTIETIARFTLIFFGIFFILVGFIMLIKPNLARNTLRKAGSSALINYTELSARMIPAIAFIIYSNYSPYPTSFRLIGYYIIITSVILMIIPRKLHHKLSNRFADFITPRMFQLISPLSVIIGVYLIFIVV